MPAKEVDITALLSPDMDRQILDVRSPGEFAKAHIAGAYNLPLFSDEERAIVGTAYKQQSPDTAMMLGLEIAGQKMKLYIKSALAIAPGKKVLVHCWRGGKRSESIGWLLAMAGFDVNVLKGGYKKYRNHALHFFADMQTKFVVIGGQTGIGKTCVLAELAEMGEQTIDLEKLANHKGSAFGSLGELPQPGTEMFENLLFDQIRTLDLNKRVFIENESHVIGKCQIPLDFFRKMKQYQYIQYSIPFEQRIEHLVKQYACYPKSELKERFQKIKTKLGGDQLKNAIRYLDEDNFGAAAEIALHFYDKAYLYGFENNPTPQKLSLDFAHADMRLIAKEIIQNCNNLNI